MSLPSNAPRNSAASTTCYHGAISPIDGIGPERLKIRELLDRADEALAHEARRGSDHRDQPHPRGRGRGNVPGGAFEGVVGSVTRIARGIPVGGDLRCADEVDVDPRAPGPAGGIQGE